jgi:hypothetical protein
MPSSGALHIRSGTGHPTYVIPHNGELQVRISEVSSSQVQIEVLVSDCQCNITIAQNEMAGQWMWDRECGRSAEGCLRWRFLLRLIGYTVLRLNKAKLFRRKHSWEIRNGAYRVFAVCIQYHRNQP